MKNILPPCPLFLSHPRYKKNTMGRSSVAECSNNWTSKCLSMSMFSWDCFLTCLFKGK